MENKYTINALKQLTSAAAQAAAVVQTVLADGTVSLTDLSEAPAMFSALQDFASVPFATLLPEASDLSKEEATELAAHFAKHFDIKNDTIEATVEAGMGILLDLAVAVKTIRDIIAQIKPSV
jgi:hypothetical protein